MDMLGYLPIEARKTSVPLKKMIGPVITPGKDDPKGGETSPQPSRNETSTLREL